MSAARGYSLAIFTIVARIPADEAVTSTVYAVETKDGYYADIQISEVMVVEPDTNS